MKYKGFTLIEVLVVSVLVSIYFIGLPQASSNFFHQKSYMLDKYRANIVGWNQLMEEYMIVQRLLNEGQTRKKGNVKLWEREWHWTKSSEKTLLGNMVEFKVQVSQQSQDNTTTAELVLFMSDERRSRRSN